MASKVPVGGHVIQEMNDVCIIKMASGYNHTLLLSKDGVIWSLGTNPYGQLSNGEHMEPCEGTYFIERRIKIVDIACGNYHNLALSSDGYVYSWGHNYYGQCQK